MTNARTDPMRRERRKSFRVEWHSPATIYQGKLARPCVVSNFSNGGAKITGVGAAIIPDEFALRINSHDTSPPCFLSDISGWSLSLVGAPPRRQATERPAGAACWPTAPIPFWRRPDRGGRRRRASSRQAADRAAGDRAGAELRGRRASRGLCKND